MTLGDFLNYISMHPTYVFAYFIGIPILAFLIGLATKKQSYDSSWSYVFSGLIYAVSVPGIFTITLMIYTFFFERRSILDINLTTQVLPIVSMIATFLIIKKFVPLNYIPGFNEIGNLFSMIIVAILALWLLDKTRIMVISFMPFHYLIIILIALLIGIRLLWRNFSK
jgi:hypothetical protein